MYQQKKITIVFYIIISIIIPSLAQNLTFCIGSAFCMGCDTVTESKCTACYNYSKGINTNVKAQSYDEDEGINNCKKDLPEHKQIIGCNYYNGGQRFSDPNDAYTCQSCDTPFLNWDFATGEAKCESIPGEACAGISKPIPSCQQTVCYKGETGNSYGCRMCKKGYAGYNWDTNNFSGSQTCMKMIVISNCNFAQQISTSSYFCYSCASNFAVSSNKKTCESFTKDPFCRKLASGNLQCEYCYHGFMWDTIKCRLKANYGIICITIIILSILVQFIQ